MPSLTTSSPGPGPDELRFADVASSATSSAQVSPNAAAKQAEADQIEPRNDESGASDAESERRSAEDPTTANNNDMSGMDPSQLPPVSVGGGGVMATQAMMAGNGVPVMYPEWGGGAAGDEYMVNGGYSVSPTAYMNMGYANGAPRRQTPTSNIAPGSPSPGGGLLSPSKAVAYSPWPAMQQQSTWSPPGGPHLGLPIWNQAHLQQQQRARAMPSMSPSSPMAQNSYAVAAAAAAASAARGKYSTPPGIPASSAGMAPYAAAAAAAVQNNGKWPSYQTDRGLMGSAPGTGGPGNATGLDSMASMEHCISDMMRNDTAMQNHYRGYMNAGSMSGGMNQYSGRQMGFLDDSGVILDDGSGMGGMDGNGMATGFPMMLGGAGGGHGQPSMGHPHMGHHPHAHHTHHGAYQQHHHAHHQQMHNVGQGNSGMGSGPHLGTVGPFPPRPSPSADGVPGQERYSRKVFVGGLPPDIDEEEITASFRRFGALIVDWPHKAESKSYFPPKGYAFLLFQEESSVQALIDACIQDDDKLYLCVSSPTIKDKPVQIRPWRLTDADYVLDASMPLDPRKTVFVGGVPRPLKAVELATIMDRLYGGVCYAGIDTDPELKYPKGAGRVAFSNQQSYIAAISARFVQLQHGDIDKRVEVKPYVLDDQMCDECGGQRCGGKFAPFFCANVTCLQYYCDSCWLTIHSRPGREYHKPLVKEGADRPRTLSSYHHRWC